MNDGNQTMLERVKFKYEDGTVIETGITENVRDDTAGGDTANDDNRMRTLIRTFDFERSRIAYSEVAAALEGIGIGWESRLNLSGERLSAF